MNKFDWSSYEEKPTSPSFNWNDYAEDKSSVSTAPSKSGWSGVLEDFKNSLTKTPGAFVDAESSLPKELYGALTQTGPRGIINLGGGVRKGLEGIANTPSNIASYLESKNIGTSIPKGSLAESLKTSPIELIKQMRVPESNLEQRLLGEPQAGDALLQGIGSALPYGPLAGAEKGLIGAARRSATAGAYGAGQNQDPIISALTGAAGEGALRGGIKGISALDPSNMFRGGLSPEELKANLSAAQGTNTPLGRIIGSPTLNTAFENVTSEVPFSGADSALSKNKNIIESKANEALEKTKPEGMEGDSNYALKQALTDAFNKNRQIKNDAYTQRDAVANNERFTPDISNFHKLASELKDGIQGSAFYSIDPVFKNLFNKVSGYEEGSKGVSQTKPGSNVVTPTITESTMLARTLGENGDKLLKSTSARDKAAGGLYKQLSSTLRDDINNSINNNGSEELKSAHQEANKNYKENYVPFLDKDIHETLNDKDPESLVAEIVRPSKKYDKFQRIQKINNLLDPEQSKLLGHEYLKGATDEFGQVNPKDLAARIKSLGDRQFKALYPDPETQQSLKNFARLRDLNEKSLSMMSNPQTGARNVKLLLAALAAKASVPGAAGAYGGSALFNKAMTSPMIREALVNRMLNKQKNIGQ